MRNSGSGLALVLLAACQSTPQQAPVEVFVLNDDGGWCWFQNERALALGEVVVLGSVAAGRHDPARRGDIELTYWWPESGELQRVELHDGLELDDHNAPALLQLDDERLLAVYAKHGNDHMVRWRRTKSDDELLEWEPEQTVEVDPEGKLGVTYSNLHRGSSPGEVYDLFRGKDWDPNLLVSGDSGTTWTWAGRVLGGPGRPYLVYSSAGDGAVHFVATEQHPRDFDNSLYHGVLRDGSVYDSGGELHGVVGEDPPAPDALTRVFQGGADAVAWPCDLELDDDGRPVVVFSVQVDGANRPRKGGGQDHRFYHGSFDGERWRVSELGYAGTRLYAGEDDYTGLAALDPANPWVVYVSTDAHPASGVALVSSADGLRHRELFRAESEDGGESWHYRELTSNSTQDQLRPVVPSGAPRVLLWLRGELKTYTDYELEVVGLKLDGVGY